MATKEFQADGRSIHGVSAVKVKWMETPSTAIMEEVPGTEFSLPADLAVLALGFDAVPDPDVVEQLHLAVDSRGRVKTRDHATSVTGVFVAGDLATGQTRVADAIASGRRAAEKIDEFLRG